MTKTETKTAKKPKRSKPTRCISLKEYIPNYRDFQKEVARLEEMLGPNADPETTLDLPAEMTREWAEEAWKVVKANAELQFRPTKPGLGFPSGIYADRAMLATLRIMNSPFNRHLRSLAVYQMIDRDVMHEKARDKRIRAEKRAAKAATAASAN